MAQTERRCVAPMVPKVLRPGNSRSKTPDKMRAAIIRVYDRGISCTQKLYQPRNRAHDIDHCGAVARSRPLEAVQNGSLDEADAFPAEQFRDRSIGMVQHDQWHKAIPGEISYQTKRGHVASANEVPDEGKAHDRLMAANAYAGRF